LLTTAISAIAWFCECLGAWLVLRGFGADISLLQATFIYAFSSIMGAVLFLPGGLGVAEASIIGLLVLFGVDRGLAVSSALIIRLCTLWLAVLVGMVTLSFSHLPPPLLPDVPPLPPDTPPLLLALAAMAPAWAGVTAEDPVSVIDCVMAQLATTSEILIPYMLATNISS